MKKLLFWLCILIMIFSVYICHPLESALTNFATKSFECFFRSDRAKEIFNLDENEAIAVFGEKEEKEFV